jgi:mono/diheme cytochrome c family protein
MSRSSGAVGIRGLAAGRPLGIRAAATLLMLAPVVAALLAACQPRPLDPQAALIAKGRELFFNETFGGNGRTCGTCHRQEDNFTITPAFIATLPKDDPLFVAEFIPALKENFENPRLMREFGLIKENLDGFDDLAERFVMRGVPHTLALSTSVQSQQGPHTGWSGDGAPGDGSLRGFATGAVIQHFTKTLNRVPGVDFRLPTDAELDALEAFQLSLGRKQELQLPLPLLGTVAARGQEIFLDDHLGKCNLCHQNAGANASIGGQAAGNASFNTGVEDLPDQPARLTDEKVPGDDGFGTPGDGTFNTPPLVEAADSGPFFHNNSVSTIEGAVGFYDGDAFNESPAGKLLAGLDSTGASIELDATQITAVAAFLRVINALENIRQSNESLAQSAALGFFDRARAVELLQRAAQETDDAITVLSGGGLHPEAVAELQGARRFIERAERSTINRRRPTRDAMAAQQRAHALLVREQP